MGGHLLREKTVQIGDQTLSEVSELAGAGGSKVVTHCVFLLGTVTHRTAGAKSANLPESLTGSL